MTRTLLRSLVFAFCALPAFAQAHSFGASVTATGGTTAVWVDTLTNHTLQVVVVSPGTCTINLDGSLDGVNWEDLSGPTTCTSHVMFHVDGKPVSYVRANLTAYSGDAPGAKVTIRYLGSK